MLNGIGLGAQGIALEGSDKGTSQDAKSIPVTLEEGKAPQSLSEALGAKSETETGQEDVKADLKPEPTKEEPLSSRFAALARKEKMALKRAQEAKAREAELEAREAKLKELEESYSLGKKNPIEALKRLGWSYEDITNHILNDGKVTPESEIKSLREEMAQWQKKQDEEKEAQRVKSEEANKASYDQAVENFKNDMRDFITSNPDEYELINLHEQEELVYATIEEHYQATLQSGKPKILSNKEACDLVEKFLENQLERVTKTKKFQSKYQSQPQGQAQKEQARPQPSKTLTNTMASSSTPTSLPAKTEEERLQRALAALTK